MSTRISYSSINARVLERLQGNYGAMEMTQKQLSSGKRIERPSDDPVAVASAMELRNEIGQYETYQRNINDGLAYLNTVDSTLNTGNQLYQNMRERAIQASNDTNSAESRMFIGREVKGMFDQMVGLSNTSFKGEFLFSGSNTQVPPYEVRSGRAVAFSAASTGGNMQLTAAELNTPLSLRDLGVTDSEIYSGYAEATHVLPGTLAVNGLKEGTDFSVDYNKGTITFTSANAVAMAATPGGIAMNFDWLRRNEKDLDGEVNRQVESGVSARMNSTASEIFGSAEEENSAWDAMIDLLDGTLNNRPDKIRSSINKLDQAMSRQLGAMASNGSRVLRFESTQGRNDERITASTELQSNIEDVDFAEAVSQFTIQQAVYEASLKMSARALQSTLANFI